MADVEGSVKDRGICIQDLLLGGVIGGEYGVCVYI